VTGSDLADLVVFDLANLGEVRSGAAELLSRCPRIDVLVNNAGVVISGRRETPDGLEATFATNHLGPFLLTNLLLDRLKASAPARIVNVSSIAHRGAALGMDFDDLQSTRHYTAMDAYAQSKLANIYFTSELARRLEGSGVTANCLHPGVIRSGYGKGGDSRGVLRFGIALIQPFIIGPARGARTSIYLASSPEVESVTGGYFVRRRQRRPARIARDANAARRLWEISEALVGIKQA
jgi:NAD(P)-dependent dehydrogenase (short-subunit alcohol dehydrogenase family)